MTINIYGDWRKSDTTTPLLNTICDALDCLACSISWSLTFTEWNMNTLYIYFIISMKHAPIQPTEWTSFIYFFHIVVAIFSHYIYLVFFFHFQFGFSICTLYDLIIIYLFFSLSFIISQNDQCDLSVCKFQKT